MSDANPKSPWRTRIAPTVGGAVLLLVGLALLADHLGYVLPEGGIALILLLAAGIAIWDSVRLALRLGAADLSIVARAIAGGLFGTIGVLLFLRISTGIILPILLMVLGTGAIVRALLARS